MQGNAGSMLSTSVPPFGLGTYLPEATQGQCWKVQLVLGGCWFERYLYCCIRLVSSSLGRYYVLVGLRMVIQEESRRKT